jgi:GcrA cell cycle regulator
MTMAWTDERIQLLQSLWEKGLSASQIATELGEGITRNAVIGKAHRLGLKSRPSPLKAVPPQKPAAKPVKEKKESEEKITILTLTERICKWPIGHPGEPDFHFCGKKSQPGQPYCAKHASMAYQSPQSKRDRARNNAAARNRVVS